MSLKSNLDESSVWHSMFRFIGYVSLPIIVYTFLSKIFKPKTQLSGKVVLITGASSGVGEALAHSFYKQGCKVVLASRRKNELNRVRDDLVALQVTVPTYPPQVLQLDLAEINNLEKCVQKVYEMQNNIDILINNGGITHRSNILSTDIDVNTKIMYVNYFGPMVLTKAVLPKMIEQKNGHIVFVSSLQGRIAIPDRAAYGASKHALQAFADTLRAEISEHNVKVSVISPGYINTALSLNALTATGDTYGVMDSATAAGYSTEYVANRIINMILYNEKELVLCPIVHRIAIFLRYMLPSLYFWIMARRAKKSNLLVNKRKDD